MGARLIARLVAVLLGNVLVFVSPNVMADDDQTRVAESVEVRVLTFNIRYGTARDKASYWPARRELVFEVIRGGDYDFVGLQEALRFQLDEIEQAVPGYTEVGVGRDDGRIAGEYSAILVRTDRWAIDQAGTFWLSDTPEIPGSKTWGNRIPRIVTWIRAIHKGTGKSLFLFNTHFDHQSARARELSARLLRQRIVGRVPQDPVIVTGDMNADESEAPVRILKGDAGDGQLRLLDTYRVKMPAGPAGTFHGFTGTDDGRKIDYVLCSPDFEVRDAAIIRYHRGPRYPSDHFPVSATLRF